MNHIKFMAVMLCLVGACGPPLQTAGGVSDTGNARVSATLFRPNGSRASNATVIVRPADFLATGPGALGKKYMLTKDTITDEAGSFQIESVEPGSYCIEVNDRTSEAVLLHLDVRAGVGDTILPADTLRSYSMLSGFAGMPKSAAGKVFATIYGLQRFVPLDSTGKFEFSNLPGGILRVHVFSTDSQFNASETDTVSSIPGKILDLPFLFWHHTRRLYLNTTASGAAVAGNVLNFPVLVRLTAADFPFNEALAGGADIRFAKSDFTPLPYEVERWNSANGAAEIWVKVDTVFGNDSSHYITMYWENSKATSASNNAAVFDTSNGFQGVWHLNEATGLAAQDATGNHYDGTAFNSGSIAPVDGMVGAAQRFDGQSGYFQMIGTASSKLDFPRNGTYAISAWAYADTIDSQFRTIASKGDFQYNLEVIKEGYWEFAEFGDKTGWDQTTNPATSKTWVYLTGIRAGSRQYLYFNGNLSDSTIGILPDTTNVRNAGFDFMIGRIRKTPTDTTSYFYKGMIDEVRITSVAPSADWIKLCFMNQKEPDALVKW